MCKMFCNPHEHHLWGHNVGGVGVAGWCLWAAGQVWASQTLTWCVSADWWFNACQKGCFGEDHGHQWPLVLFTNASQEIWGNLLGVQDHATYQFSAFEAHTWTCAHEHHVGPHIITESILYMWCPQLDKCLKASPSAYIGPQVILTDSNSQCLSVALGDAFKHLSSWYTPC